LVFADKYDRIQFPEQPAIDNAVLNLLLYPAIDGGMDPSDDGGIRATSFCGQPRSEDAKHQDSVHHLYFLSIDNFADAACKGKIVLPGATDMMKSNPRRYAVLLVQFALEGTEVYGVAALSEAICQVYGLGFRPRALQRRNDDEALH
jgi:hypothetical protein